ncbi:TPA: hypothetical protein N2O04_000257 [Citrobacter freundii]|nr:hypothetical protein [Citrobacter freundii]
MAKIVKSWNVMVTTSEMIAHGQGPMLVGTQMSPSSDIRGNFLVYKNLNGADAGINLSQVLAFSIEPQYEE